MLFNTPASYSTQSMGHSSKLKSTTKYLLKIITSSTPSYLAKLFPAHIPVSFSNHHSTETSGMSVNHALCHSTLALLQYSSSVPFCPLLTILFMSITLASPICQLTAVSHAMLDLLSTCHWAFSRAVNSF